MNTLADSYNYNDLASLNNITKLGQSDESAALKQIARQFESMFVTMMLKSMRDANAVFEEGNPLNTYESKFYRQMFDDQLALSLTKDQGIGLADSIYRQLQQQLDTTDASIVQDKDVPIRRYSGSNPFGSYSNKLEDADIGEPAKLSTDPISETVNVKVKPAQAANEPVKKQSVFTSPQDFVDTLWPVAKKVGKEMGVDPKAIMAQTALETGWGKYIIHHGDGSNSHNLFGIKADHRWKGDVAKVSTLEFRNGVAQKEVAPFRSYDSYEHSLKDYAAFVSGSARYEKAIENGQSIKGYSEGLQQGGYATDPEYAKKIQRIASGEVLNEAIKRNHRG